MRTLTTLLLLMLSLSSLAEEITTVNINSSISLESENSIVNKYKEINHYLSSGDIESASKLTTNPKQYHAKMSAYMMRVGEVAFTERYLKYSEMLTVHSVLSIDDKHLLIVGPDSTRIGANGFIVIADEILLSPDRDSSQMKALYEEFKLIQKRAENEDSARY